MLKRVKADLAPHFYLCHIFEPGRGRGDKRCEQDNLLHGGGDGHQRPRRSFRADVNVGDVVEVVLVYRRDSHSQSL